MCLGSNVACFCVPRFWCYVFLCSAILVLCVSVFRVSGVTCFCVPRFWCYVFLCSAILMFYDSGVALSFRDRKVFSCV